MGERNGEKQENEVNRMKLLARIKNYFSEVVEETNLDWRIIALDLNRELIETREENKILYQRIADLEKLLGV